METLKNLLDKLYGESETRNKENEAISDYESISYEVGIQSTIKEIREWVDKNSYRDTIDELIVVRVE
jgi:hypothetical protein